MGNIASRCTKGEKDDRVKRKGKEEKKNPRVIEGKMLPQSTGTGMSTDAANTPATGNSQQDELEVRDGNTGARPVS